LTHRSLNERILSIYSQTKYFNMSAFCFLLSLPKRQQRKKQRKCLLGARKNLEKLHFVRCE
jgi:hypothetical protein